MAESRERGSMDRTGAFRYRAEAGHRCGAFPRTRPRRGNGRRMRSTLSTTRRDFLRFAALSPAVAMLVAARAEARALFPDRAAATPAGGPSPGRPTPLEVRRGERLLVVAPHPDDETIAAGGLMQRVIERGGTALVVLVTAGDGFVDAVVREYRTGHPKPAQYIAYGERRVGESKAALRALDPEAIDLELLGFPDGGLDGLLRTHWERSNPSRSRTTGASDPPYDDEALAPNLPYDGTDLRRELGRIVRAARPSMVVLPDPLDTHPDHHAASVFTLLAVGDWHRDMPSSGHATTKLLSYLVHWPAWPPEWDRRAPSPEDARMPLWLPEGVVASGAPTTWLELDDAEIARKRTAMNHYVSQQAVSAAYLAAFVRRTEPFRRLGETEVKAAFARVPADDAKARVRTASR